MSPEALGFATEGRYVTAATFLYSIQLVHVDETNWMFAAKALKSGSLPFEDGKGAESGTLFGVVFRDTCLLLVGQALLPLRVRTFEFEAFPFWCGASSHHATRV